MKRLERREAPRGVISGMLSHPPLVDQLDSIGGIRATVHVAVLTAERAMQEGGGDSCYGRDGLVRDYALRRLREDLPYLLLAIGSSSPEGVAARAEAADGLRIVSRDPGGGNAGALSSRLLGAMEGMSAPAAATLRPEEVRKAVLAVEASEKALGCELDQFEGSRRKIVRHRAYEGLEALLPEMLLSLDADPHEAASRRGLALLKERVTPLLRPAAVLARIVLERLEIPADAGLPASSRGASPGAEAPSAAGNSVDLA